MLDPKTKNNYIHKLCDGKVEFKVVNCRGTKGKKYKGYFCWRCKSYVSEPEVRLVGITYETNKILNDKKFAKEIIELYKDRPYDFVVDILKVKPSLEQEKVLRALERGERFISVKSGHGVGKTSLESWIIIWFLFTRVPCKIPATAPTYRQLNSILWPELYKWSKNSLIADKIDISKTKIKIKGAGDDWFGAAVSSSRPDNMQGFHEENLLFIIDEAPGVPEEIMVVIQGALTTKGSLCIMMGNPTKVFGAFYNSFHKDKEDWATFTFNSEKSKLVDKSYCERMAKKFGKDSDIYRVRVLGEFPKSESDTIFSIDEVIEAQRREIPEPSIKLISIGVDVARFGDDRTSIALKHGNLFKIEKKFYKQDTMTTAGEVYKIIMDLEKDKELILKVNIDDTGVGGGVTDRLNELKALHGFRAEIRAVNFGSRPSDPENYANKGTELWFKLKEIIKDCVLPDDEDLLGELTTRKKKISSNGTPILEKKEDMKKRGLVSPDIADSIILTLNEGESYGWLEDSEGVIF